MYAYRPGSHELFSGNVSSHSGFFASCGKRVEALPAPPPSSFHFSKEPHVESYVTVSGDGLSDVKFYFLLSYSATLRAPCVLNPNFCCCFFSEVGYWVWVVCCFCLRCGDGFCNRSTYC